MDELLIPRVGSGPVDPDPPPPPHRLLQADVLGSVAVDGHFVIDGLDRWPAIEVDEHGPRWGLADTAGPMTAAITQDVLEQLRRCSPDRDAAALVVFGGVRFSLRRVLLRTETGPRLCVQLCAVP